MSGSSKHERDDVLKTRTQAQKSPVDASIRPKREARRIDSQERRERRTPEGVRTLLADFHKELAATYLTAPIKTESMLYAARAFEKWNAGGVTLDHAFGLARKAGRPSLAEKHLETVITIARAGFRGVNKKGKVRIDWDAVMNAFPPHVDKRELQRIWSAFGMRGLEIVIRERRGFAGQDYGPQRQAADISTADRDHQERTYAAACGDAEYLSWSRGDK